MKKMRKVCAPVLQLVTDDFVLAPDRPKKRRSPSSRQLLSEYANLTAKSALATTYGKPFDDRDRLTEVRKILEQRLGIGRRR